MLTDAQRTAYERDGFIVVPDVFSPAEIGELRAVTDEFVRNAAAVTANDEVYDLEDTHSREEPRVRRLKAPHLIHPAYFRASRNDKVVAILKELWGSVRFDTGKLNMKSAGFGAPSNGTRIGPSIRTPMTISRLSASCSTMSIGRTGRCWSSPGATRDPFTIITGQMAGSAARWIRRAAVPISPGHCRASERRAR